MRGSDVLFVDTLLSQLEKKLRIDRRIGLEVLIRRSRGDDQCGGDRPVLSAARSINLRGWRFFGVARDRPRRRVWAPTAIPENLALRAAQDHDRSARGRHDAVDGPFGNFNDAATYSEECRRAKLMGMVGKWAISPSAD